MDDIETLKRLIIDTKREVENTLDLNVLSNIESQLKKKLFLPPYFDIINRHSKTFAFDRWSFQSLDNAIISYVFFPIDLMRNYELIEKLYERPHIRTMLSISARNKNLYALIHLWKIGKSVVEPTDKTKKYTELIQKYITSLLETENNSRNNDKPYFIMNRFYKLLGNSRLAKECLTKSLDQMDVRAWVENAIEKDDPELMNTVVETFGETNYEKIPLVTAFSMEYRHLIFYHLIIAGEKGVSEGYYRAGKMIEFGEFVATTQDIEGKYVNSDPSERETMREPGKKPNQYLLAINYYINAGKLGNITAYGNAGDIYLGKFNRVDKAIELFTLQVQNGDPRGYLSLYFLYKYRLNDNENGEYYRSLYVNSLVSNDEFEQLVETIV